MTTRPPRRRSGNSTELAARRAKISYARAVKEAAVRSRVSAAFATAIAAATNGVPASAGRSLSGLKRAQRQIDAALSAPLAPVPTDDEVSAWFLPFEACVLNASRAIPSLSGPALQQMCAERRAMRPAHWQPVSDGGQAAAHQFWTGCALAPPGVRWRCGGHGAMPLSRRPSLSRRRRDLMTAQPHDPGASHLLDALSQLLGTRSSEDAAPCIYFLGDSVPRQLWEAAQCEVQRVMGPGSTRAAQLMARLVYSPLTDGEGRAGGHGDAMLGRLVQAPRLPGSTLCALIRHTLTSLGSGLDSPSRSPAPLRPCALAPLRHRWCARRGAAAAACWRRRSGCTTTTRRRTIRGIARGCATTPGCCCPSSMRLPPRATAAPPCCSPPPPSTLRARTAHVCRSS